MKRSHDGDELVADRADLYTAPQAYDKAFPFFRKPMALGGFSLDARRQFHHDRRHLKFYRTRSSLAPPPSSSASSSAANLGQSDVSFRVNIDLNAGVERAVRKNEDEQAREGLSNLLRWILVNRHRFLPPGGAETQQAPQGAAGFSSTSSTPPASQSLQTDFVCYRGCLTTVMCAPFENREDWRLTAVRHRGTIYLHKEETREQREHRQRMNERQRAMCSWGYKFEQQLLSDSVGEAVEAAANRQSRTAATQEAVNEAEEFCCVYRTRLGKYSIVYGAEMDAVAVSDSLAASSSPPGAEGVDLNKEEFVELKTSRHLEHPGQERTFRRFKLIKWWCQSFLVGISTIVAGFRDDAGVVSQVVEYPVRELPRHCSDHWQPNVCMNFLHEFLGYVKESLVGTDDLTEVHFYWSPRLRRVVREEPAVASSFQQPQRILPEWFLHSIFTQAR